MYNKCPTPLTLLVSKSPHIIDGTFVPNKFIDHVLANEVVGSGYAKLEIAIVVEVIRERFL